MIELDQAFGTLRALMQARALGDKPSLLAWLIEIESLDPDRYHAQWVPYLASFPHHWGAPLATVGTIDELEQVARVAPFAELTFDGSAWAGLRRHAISQGKIPPKSYPPGFLNAFGFNDQEMSRLVKCSALKQVTHLNLVWGDLTHQGVAMLARCPDATHLKTLELRYHYNITDEGIHALAQSPYITQLEHLDVSQTASSAEGFKALAGSPFSKHLKTLKFWNGVDQTSIAHAFNTSTSLTNLTHLDLSEVSNQDICDILNSPNATTLQTFTFHAVDPMTPEQIHQISASPYINALQSLEFADLELSTPHIKPLCQSEHLIALHTLDLSSNPITTEGIQQLAGAPWLSQIKSLDLSYTPLGQGALDALDTPSFQPTHLALNQGLYDSNVTLDETLARWLATPSSANLQHLELGCAQLPTSIHALAEATHITQLTELELQYTQLPLSSLVALTKSPVSQTLQKLNLSWIWEDQELETLALCYALQASPYMTQLTHLSMEDLPITDEALIALSQAPMLSSVTHLNITGYQFSNDALRQFAASPYLTNLVELSIDLVDDYDDDRTMSEQRTILYRAPTLSDTFRASLDPNNHLQIW